eukprot:6199758-Pleurochrysis_carterae.AAC.1
MNRGHCMQYRQAEACKRNETRLGGAQTLLNKFRINGCIVGECREAKGDGRWVISKHPSALRNGTALPISAVMSAREEYVKASLVLFLLPDIDRSSKDVALPDLQWRVP